MNMVDEKYRNKYKGSSDWIGEFIKSNVNKDAGDGKSTYDAGLMRKLAEKNGVDASKLAEANVGRARMTIGNQLRARAKKRHGLFDINGAWVKAPEDFLKESGAPDSPMEDKNGNKIAKEKEAA